MFHHTRQIIEIASSTPFWKDILDVLGFLVLLATLIVVWIYTKAAQQANEINEAPLLNLTLSNLDDIRNITFTVENIGRGPAYNVEIEKFSLGNYTYRFYLESRLLTPNKLQNLKMAVHTPDGGVEAPSIELFFSRLDEQTGTRVDGIQANNNPAIVIVNCQGVSGKKYYFVFAVYSPIIWSAELIVQFVMRGTGKITLDQAKKAWEYSEKISSSVH